MATYKVKIGSADGTVMIRNAQGREPAEIRQSFQNEGFYVFSVTRAFSLREWLGIQRRIPRRKFIMFNKELRGLVKAGLPIVEGLDILLKRMKPGPIRQMLETVRSKLTQGESLSEAFRHFEDVIPRYYPALIHAGEQSGDLVEVLDRFIIQEERIARARSRFLQTLTYPSLLIIVGIVSLYLILTRAMPQFAAIYTDAGQDLPMLTSVVIGISNTVINYHRWILLFTFAAMVAGFLYLRTAKGKRIWERTLRHMPIVGALWNLQNQTIFARTMRMLLSGGVPVPQSLSVVAHAVPSLVLSSELKAAHHDVVQGASLQDALETHTQLSDLAGEMLRVGEASGTLTDMFEHLADHGDEMAENRLETISNLVAPLVLLVVGIVIALFVVAMYLPMFGSYNAL